MTAVLFWVPRLDALDVDAEAQPPDGQLRQTEQGVAGGEGHAVVCSDGSGQPEVLESSLENTEGKVRACRGNAFTGEQITGSIVGDGEWITVLAVAEHELAFVVSAPETVRCVSTDQWRSLGFIASLLPALHQAVAIEYGMHCANRGRLEHRELQQKLVTDLARSPGRMLFLDA